MKESPTSSSDRPLQAGDVRSRWFDVLPRFYLPLLLIGCAAQCWRALSGNDDVWAHAAIGRWIAEHGQVPNHSLFVWGAQPIDWVYHSWLSQWVFYKLLSQSETLGPRLLQLLVVAAVLFVFWSLWRMFLSRSKSTFAPAWLPIIFLTAITASSLRFHPRPELFTALSLLLLLVLWLGDEDESKLLDWKSAAIFLLFVLWANFHGAVALGLLVVWSGAIAETLQDRKGLHAVSVATRRHLLWAVLASVAIWINPYGFDYWEALKPVGGAAFGRIDEWKPFWHTPFLNPLIVVSEAVLVIFALVGCSGSRRRWSQFVWVVLFSLLFLSARRHMWLLSIVTLAVIAANAKSFALVVKSTFDKWSAAQSEREKMGVSRFARIGALVVLVLWIASVLPAADDLHRPVARQTPVQAADFVVQKYSGERVFNDYENSSYLQWRFAGKPPLYIDLLNAYPEQLVFDYLDIVNARPRGKQLLREHGITLVILRKYDERSTLNKLANHLKADRRWHKKYSGEDGTIWLRQ